MTKAKAGVIVFPGTNCDRDTSYAVKYTADIDVDYVWYEKRSLRGYQLVLIPGGFSYGDYLRAGALARFSPVMEALRDYSDRGGMVLGICNGFQILLEASMLPGAMQKNKTLRFICRDVTIRVERNDTPFTLLYRKGEVLRIPIAHADGNYYASRESLRHIEDDDRVVFRYVDGRGRPTQEANPNGSVNGIAGMCNAGGNILAMMPGR
ncbi:MAG: phosphoribosylformylglycinamidine synthase subunit PurQ [Deltaproteobacteria bacterium]|nr:phosphoribosylformylglycinamidine synthase subunit PurQ [Deltaproteobacteria bacterium]